MTPRTLWLLFALLCLTMIAVPKLRAEQIAMCNEDECIIKRDLLMKMMNGLIYWHDKAEKCSAI